MFIYIFYCGNLFYHYCFLLFCFDCYIIFIPCMFFVKVELFIVSFEFALSFLQFSLELILKSALCACMLLSLLMFFYGVVGAGFFLFLFGL